MQKLTDHIVSGYDEELNELTRSIAELGNIVEGMVSDALKSVKKRDSDLAKQVSVLLTRPSILPSAMRSRSLYTCYSDPGTSGRQSPR